jgi:hypothetical protein
MARARVSRALTHTRARRAAIEKQHAVKRIRDLHVGKRGGAKVRTVNAPKAW